jgi:hypothetical protein
MTSSPNFFSLTEFFINSIVGLNRSANPQVKITLFFSDISFNFSKPLD